MTHLNDHALSENDRLIDRLVDGELTDTERRTVLARLDREPDGWRRCALAFLEAQCWRQVLGPLAGERGHEPAAPTLQAVPPVQRGSHRQEKWRSRALRNAMVRVAAVVLAFGLGLIVGGAGRPAGTPTEVVPQAARGMARTPQPDRPGAPLARSDHAEPIAGATSEIPLREVSELDKTWLAELPPAMPAYVQRKWEQRGYRVETRRQLVSASLADGRRVAIPVDQVRLHYVGQPVY